MNRILLLFYLFFVGVASAQQVENVDKAFLKARTLAFSGQYEASKKLCKSILVKSPGYQDVSVLLARVYYWNNQPDSAMIQIRSAIAIKPYEEAYIAASDMERWSDHSESALSIADDGLRFFSVSEELTIRKAKALADLDRFKEGYQLLDSLLLKKPQHSEARQLSERYRAACYSNNVSLSYDYDHFDKQFKDDWHMLSASYGRRTKYFGSVTARVNLANRFKSSGAQYELDMYPSLGKKMYMYLSGGYSDDFVFAKYRGGLSIFRNLPKSFEIEIGVRVLTFTRNTWMYTGSIGKYYGNFWFSLRPTFIACDNVSCLSQSYSLITRFYTKSASDYLTLTIGYGLSPDDRSKQSLLINPDLKTFRLMTGIQRTIGKRTLVFGNAGFISQEFYRGDKIIGNDYTFGIGCQRYF